MAEFEYSSINSSQDWYISMFAYAMPLNKTIPRNNDRLTIKFRVVEGIIPIEPVINNRLGKVKQPKIYKTYDDSTMEPLRSIFLSSNDDDQPSYPYLQRFLYLMIRERLDLFELEPLDSSKRIFHWGVHHFQNPSSEMKNVDEIIDLLAHVARETAKRDINCELNVLIKKLERLPCQEFQEIARRIDDANEAKNCGLHPLAGWMKEKIKSDVNFNYYFEFIFELRGRESGWKSVEVKKQEGEEQMCPICIKNMEQGSQAIKMPCGDSHVFHGECILEWFIRKNKLTCPLCRFQLN